MIREDRFAHLVTVAVILISAWWLWHVGRVPICDCG